MVSFLLARFTYREQCYRYPTKETLCWMIRALRSNKIQRITSVKRRQQIKRICCSLSVVLHVVATAACSNGVSNVNPESIEREFWMLVREATHCTENAHCALMHPGSCWTPCGGPAVNPAVVPRLEYLEKLYVESTGELDRNTCIAVPACRSTTARCVSGACKSVYVDENR